MFAINYVYLGKRGLNRKINKNVVLIYYKSG